MVIGGGVNNDKNVRHCNKRPNGRQISARHKAQQWERCQCESEIIMPQMIIMMMIKSIVNNDVAAAADAADAAAPADDDDKTNGPTAIRYEKFVFRFFFFKYRTI